MTLTTNERSAVATFRRGLALSPEFRTGLPVTLLLAVAATIGKVIVPIAIQQVIDRGLKGATPDIPFIRGAVAWCAVAVLVTAVCGYLMNVRLYRSTESGLATLRGKGFRHVHDLSVLTQNTERRGALVSRVTGDVDQISTFMQWGGLMVIVSLGQLLIASVLMTVYSWQLALLVWACFVPLVIALPRFQRWVARAYTEVRERTGDMLAAVSESVVGSAVIRAYGSEERTARRIDQAVDAHRAAQTRAQKIIAFTFPITEMVGAVAIAGVVLLGVGLGVDGTISAGRLIAFLFLITLFISPLQTATEVLNDAQNALAGWRRVLGVLDTVADVADPGEAGAVLPRGAITVTFENVGFSYPGGPPVLHEVSVEIPPRTRVAVVGETGSGKSTFAKLLTRLMDPTEGRVLVDGVDLRRVRFSSLRERVVMVPQDGFLFDGSLADNIRYGRPEATDEDIALAVTELGLADWLEGLPAGLATPVGQRGESLSAGERQLVALARAYLADPDLLLLDEATSAVDPATEVRIARALDGVTRGRTAVSIAHRLSTAEAADEVLVFDRGRIVQRGPHAELLRVDGIYADLYASWTSAARTS
ncbi:multidrug ABC transporter ATP-binding protein [Sphaerisporangium krabiense]|uniref:Putative ABC transport system ATP-binding protein n=1 Tax=Sphaerisporangium krabiense TaxID=763782 RepID=A0A7W8Z8F5_9ACTN|nr:ABC transporter ATP-binding protein [Sphaerisporangium krabiense]MBB5629358.1 putative ABC transport system ATP-binding protein [Sphaerisporangium krabiense]GII65791.1 multidrug ABC transporter ATP-binding protein [Sphaerisporangium krabiense]